MNVKWVIPAVLVCAGHSGSLRAAQAALRPPHHIGRLTLVYQSVDGQETKPQALQKVLNEDLGWIWLWYLEPGLEYRPLEKEKWEAFSKSMTLASGSDWVMLATESDPIASGGNVPSGSRIWQNLRDHGVPGGPSVLTEFLQKHPSSGEGWASMGLGAVALQASKLRSQAIAARQLNGAASAPESRTFTPVPELLESLHNLSQSEEWAATTATQRLFGGPMGMSFLLRRKSDAVAGGPLEEMAFPMFRDVVAALKEDPTNLGLRASYKVLVDLVPGQDSLTPLFAIPTDPLLPDPWAWASLWAQPLVHRKAWVQLRELSGEGWNRNPKPDLEWAQDQMLDGPEDRVQGWGRYKLMALCGLGREDEAKAWIEILRAESGENWNPQDPDLNTSVRQFPESEGRTRLTQSLAEKGIKQAKPTKSIATKSVSSVVYLSGPEKEIRAWPRHPSLAFWTQDELRWEIRPSPAEEGVSYQVWQGKEQLSHGRLEDPKPEAMAQILAAQAPSRIHRLEALVQGFPHYRPALRSLVKELITRMPNALLEDDLLRQMRRLKEAPPVPAGEGWKPDPRLWSPFSREMCAHCEFRLSEFPTDRDTWQAWLFWNALSLKPASIADVVERTPHWQPLTLWAAGLPASAIDALVKDLFQQGRNDELLELALNLKSHPQIAAWRADQGDLSATTQAILQRIRDAAVPQNSATPSK